MSGDNPFLEPNPQDRTVILRPVPGGRPAAAGAPPPPASRPDERQAPAEAGPAGVPATSQPPLLEAAAELLLLIASVRYTTNPPDAAELRQRTIAAIRRFDTAARAAGLPQEMVHPARYVLCATIDDTVLNTPWGGASIWVQASLVSTLHQEVISGEGFFLLLASLQRDAARNVQLLSLIYLCLSLGYQGQYRLSPRGPAELDTVRENLYATLQRLLPPHERALSLQWQGVAAPYRPGRAVLPLWVMAAVTVLLVALGWAGCRWYLAPRSDALMDRAAGLPPLHMPALDRVALAAAAAPPPAPAPAPTPGLIGKLGFLQPQIDAGEVAVQQSPRAIRVIIFDLGQHGVFDSGSADVRPGFMPLLSQIGDAIDTEPGAVVITGHTDSRPIHTMQFPSNYELSTARAAAAGALLGARLHDATRLSTVGYAAQQPRDSNDTELGRDHNRRIEIILQQPRVSGAGQ